MTPAAEDFARRLDAGLRGLPADERERIVLEIRGHLAERGEAGLAALGAPETLAKTYMEDFRMTQAIAQANPAALLLTILDRAGRNAAAAVIGFVAVTLYLMSAGFLVVAVLKPFFPTHVGLWLDPFSFGAWVNTATPAGPEVLGWWTIPVGLVLGLVCGAVAGPLMRWGAERLIKRPVFGS
ncbi:DUF1700 domain-containing protein [Caulobacter sp. 17J80-11]|uniref:DUF1700 domain-containing protein n=1 Tax=Caulobacter sp. 17J80-11 TaxID=2763502 RepID=UPI0016538F66|nr:hypothetical protein [Caulobacter sp. 17J80-11]MBC6982084.1 hypothetical protein [Caulobacter sp. 17J80-11]